MESHEYKIPNFSQPLSEEDYVLLVVFLRHAHYQGMISSQEAKQIIESFPTAGDHEI